MSDVGVLKEFLVKLGFKVDNASANKMDGIVKDITRSVNELGIATDLSLAAVTAFTIKAADTLDKLYFVSQRTGSTVANIQSVSYATSQLGGSADNAQASIENLGHFIRTYPGSADFLKRLGVKAENVNDSARAMEDLGRTFQKMPFWQAQPYANMLGIDEKTLLALQSGQLNKWMDDYNRRLKEVGVDADHAAESGNKLMTAIRGLGAEASIVGAALVDGPFGRALLWAVGVMDDIAHGAALIFHDPAAAQNSFTQAGARNLRAGVSGLGNMVGGAISTTAVGDARTRNMTGTLGGAKWKQVVDYFVGQGWSEAQANGIAANLYHESKFDPGAVNSIGMAGVAQWDTKRRAAFKKWNGGRDVIGSSMEEQLGFIQYELGTSEKRAAQKLRETNTPADAAGAFSTYYERPGLNQAQTLSEARLRGDIANKGVTISQQNTYHVTGSDPHSTATAIQGRQNDANNQLVRNVQGAVR